MEKLIEILKSYKSIILGFSGGCDSTLLLHAAMKANIKILAVTFHSRMYPESELKLAVDTAELLSAPHKVIHFDPLDITELENNPKERCYICKKRLFAELVEIAKAEGFCAVMDGSNKDDLKDYRPGFAALQELGVKSPLVEAGFTKDTVRNLLKEAGLLQWDKPSFACYFSRFPYNTHVDEKSVERVAKSEEGLHALGLNSARVRFHGDVARIETNKEDFHLCLSDEALRLKIIKTVKIAGFRYVSLDLEGYRTGSMNEVL